MQAGQIRKLSLDCEVFDGKYKTKEHTYFKKSPNSSSVVIDPGLQITLQLSAKTKDHTNQVRIISIITRFNNNTDFFCFMQLGFVNG